MKKGFFFVVLLIAFLSGCATASYYQKRNASGWLDLESFLSQRHLKLKILPFSGKFVLEGKGQRIVLRDKFNYALIDGKICRLKSDVLYKNGKLLIPVDILNYLRKIKKRKAAGAKIIPIEIKTVVIDPGHGGRDPGAISPWGLREKEVNLSIAKSLYRRLKKSGLRVYLTRYSDYFVSLKQRVLYARRKKADLFISIHANSCPSKSVRGLSVYYLADRFTNKQARILAAAENMCQRRGLSFSSDVKRIIGDLINAENRRETYEIADIVLAEAKRFGIPTRGKIGAPFYVLKYNLCPAILVETGYLTNYKEEKMLRSRLYRQQIADALAEAVLRLRRRYRGRTLVKYED